jgi:hypothetical protein
MANKPQIQHDKAYFESSSLAEALEKALPKIIQSVDNHEKMVRMRENKNAKLK